MKTKIFWLGIFLASVLVSFENAKACSCTGKDTPAKEYVEAKYVFVGSISNLSRVSNRSGFSDLRAIFDIEEVFKGNKEVKQNVFTSTQGTACGYPFQENGRYLVYAYLDEETKSLETNICTRTRRLSFGKLDDEVEILRSLAKGKLKPRIYGTVYELIRGLYPLRSDYWKDRKPMSGIKIIAKNGIKKFEAISDSEGKFRIINLSKGKYKLEFVVPPNYKIGGDYWDETTEDEKNQYKNIELEITENTSPDQLTIETRIDGRIKGKVFYQNGKAVGKNVMVSLISKETAESEVGDIDYVHAYTDANGVYEFFGILQGEYYLGFNIETKPHKEFPYPRIYFPNSADLANAKVIVLGKGEKVEGFNLTLPKAVEEIEVKGKVVDVNGNPIKDAVVERYGLYYSEWREGGPYSMKYIKQPSFEGRVTTDAKGEFSIKLLRGNKYRLNPFLLDKDSYKDLLEGDELEIEVKQNMKPIILVLDKKPK